MLYEARKSKNYIYIISDRLQLLYLSRPVYSFSLNVNAPDFSPGSGSSLAVNVLAQGEIIANSGRLVGLEQSRTTTHGDVGACFWCDGTLYEGMLGVRM